MRLGNATGRDPRSLKPEHDARLSPLALASRRVIREDHPRNALSLSLARGRSHEGELLESYVTKTRNNQAALAFTRKVLKRYGLAEAITTNDLRSYRAVMTTLGNKPKRRLANNRVGKQPPALPTTRAGDAAI